MNPMLADIIGFIGSGVMIFAYAYSNMAKKIDFVLFNFANLIGAAMLITSLAVHFNMASMALEVVWAIIAAIGLVKALTARKARA